MGATSFMDGLHDPVRRAKECHGQRAGRGLIPGLPPSTPGCSFTSALAGTLWAPWGSGVPRRWWPCGSCGMSLRSWTSAAAMGSSSRWCCREWISGWTRTRVHSLGVYVRLEPSLAEKINVPRASIQTMVSNSVLEHLPRLDTMLRKVVQILRPGGRLVFSVYRSTDLFSGWLLLLVRSYAVWRNRQTVSSACIAT